MILSSWPLCTLPGEGPALVSALLLKSSSVVFMTFFVISKVSSILLLTLSRLAVANPYIMCMLIMTTQYLSSWIDSLNTILNWILIRLNSKHVLHHLWDMSSAQRGSNLAPKLPMLLWIFLNLGQGSHSTFLGHHYLPIQFCPNLSEVVHPVRDHTHVDQEFLSADQHTEAFTKANGLVSKAPAFNTLM